MSGRSSRGGFTLIELLVVIAIMGVLGAIVMATHDGVRERAAISRAEGELALLGHALERYRTAHGDYPWIVQGRTGEQTLYGALVGALAPDGRRLSGGLWKTEPLDLSGVPVGSAISGKPVTPRPEAAGGYLISFDRDWEDHVFLDPWGSAYVYRYRPAAGDVWERRGYLLLSLGPSGGEAVAEDGVETPDLPASGLLPPGYREGGRAYDDIIAGL